MMCLETGTRIPADVLECTEQLPVLRDETQSIGGFHNILGHLHSESFPLERDGQAARERADIIAYVLSSFTGVRSQQKLSVHAQILILHRISRATTARFEPLRIKRELQLKYSPRIRQNSAMATKVVYSPSATQGRQNSNRTP